MGKRYGKHHVRLDDGTCWAVDHVDNVDEQSLEWILRYGSPEHLLRARFAIASVVASYKALLDKPQRRRNAIVSEINRALSLPNEGNLT